MMSAGDHSDAQARVRQEVVDIIAQLSDEKLQRHFRPLVLRRLGVTLAETVFQYQDETYLFNEYVEALEELRLTLSLSEDKYYIGLLNTRINQRPGYLHNLGGQLNAEEQSAFRRRFAKHSATLRKNIIW